MRVVCIIFIDLSVIRKRFFLLLKYTYEKRFEKSSTLNFGFLTNLLSL